MNKRIHSFSTKSAIHDVLPADYSKIDKNALRRAHIRSLQELPVVVQ